MAKEILNSIVQGKTVEHTVSHDLESFAWVFAYVVLRRLLCDSGDETNSTVPKDARLAVKTVYNQSFGALDLETVLTQRHSLRVFDLEENSLDRLVPAAIANFVGWLGMMVAANYVGLAKPVPLHLVRAVPPQIQQKMSHADVILTIDTAIQRLASELLPDE